MSNASLSIINALNPSDREDQAQRRALLAEIDASCRTSLFFLIGGSLVWLIVGTFFALITSWKLHSPEFLANYSWLTFGRMRPAHLNAVIFGFALSSKLFINGIAPSPSQGTNQPKSMSLR